MSKKKTKEKPADIKPETPEPPKRDFVTLIVGLVLFVVLVYMTLFKDKIPKIIKVEEPKE